MNLKRDPIVRGFLKMKFHIGVQICWASSEFSLYMVRIKRIR